MVHVLSDYLIAAGVGSGVFFISFFGMRLFAHSRRPRLRRFFLLIASIGAFTSLSVLFGAYNQMAPILFISTLVLIFILTLLSLIDIRHNVEGGGLYLAAFGISNIGYAAQILRLLGVLPVAWWNTEALQVSSLFNMILMTLAMTERVRRAEMKALQSALESEQKAVGLAENMTVNLRTKHQELEQALERKDRFVEMVSHEYRTPLAIIQANLDILELREEAQGSMVSNNVSKMKRAVARLVNVIESSLTSSRLQPEEMEKHFELLDAAGLLEDVSAEARTLWPDSAILLPAENLLAAHIMADPSLLKTALLNLIDNAVKYAASAGPITLSITFSATEICLSVADMGPGIPEKDRGTVCEKYHRGQISIGKTGEGLGLFLVSKIVEEHRGRLEFSSNDPTGTIAAVVLPRIIFIPQYQI